MMKSKACAHICGFLLALLPVLPLPQAWAGEGLFEEMGISFFVHQDIDLGDSDLKSAGLSIYWAAPLLKNENYQLDFRLEGQAAGFWNNSNAMELALVPALRFYPGCSCSSGGPRFYVEAGIGPSYNNLNIEEVGTPFEFLSFGGLGMRWPWSKDLNLEIGYRMRHISNAGISINNHGVTSNQLHLGLSWNF